MPVLNKSRLRYLAHRARHLIPAIITGHAYATYIVGVNGRIFPAYDGQPNGYVAAFFTATAAYRRAEEVGANARVYRQSGPTYTTEIAR